jgi:two-component system response regulator AtoC
VVEFHNMVTADPQMKELFAVLSRVARTEAPVLVRGETGTGKELVASAIHRLSGRRNGPFRAINCAALPANLLESELFGHVRGAFTGAVRDTPGHFQLAGGGTLFLDEIGEVPLELQAKLLRAIEAKQVTPVGGRTPVTVDVRIVSATHRALRREVEQGRFRADLMYRLRVIPVYLPPLRERPGDIGVLVNRIAVELNAQGDRHVDVVAPETLALLERWPFPGNVRELRNVLVYAWAIGTGPVLLPGDLPYEVREGEFEPTPAVVPSAGSTPALSERSAEAERIARVLERAGGSRARAARVLGISRVTLWRRMKELGLLDGQGEEP